VGGDIPEASTPQSAAEDLTNGLEKTARNLTRLSELLLEMERLCRALPEGDAARSTLPPAGHADAAPADARNVRLAEEAKQLRKQL